METLLPTGSVAASVEKTQGRSCPSCGTGPDALWHGGALVHAWHFGILQGLTLVALGVVTSRKCKGNSFFHGRRKTRDSL